MKKEKNYLYRFLRIIYTLLLKLIFRPRIYGKENIPENGAIILAGNHKHAIDPIMVMSSTKRVINYMAKEELFKGLHGAIFKKIGLIKIYRNKGNPLAVIEATKILEKGGAIGIFPEGKRNKTEKELLRFRHGTVAIAQKANAKIVPFAIKGKYKIFRKSVVLEFGKAIDISKMTLEQANQYLENKVLQLLRK